MGAGVTNSVNAPANQAGHGAASSSADSAARSEFAQAKQSASAEKPTSFEDLTNLCLPWDNDEAGLLKNIPPPRECRVPHPVISPEAMLDDDPGAKPLEVPGETIEVHGKAPPESPLANAVRRGIAEIPTKDQFEKHLLRQANHFAKNWSIERWHDYIQGPPPEGFTEAEKFQWQKAATNWQEYVTQAYNQAWDKAEAMLLDNYRRIDVANRAVESNLKSQVAGVFFAAAPAAGAVYGGWTAGVSGVEAISGHKSGMQVADLASGNWGDHRKLSPPERIGLAAEAGLGVTTMATGYALQRAARGTPRSGSNAGVVSGEIDSRKLAGGAPHAPAPPKVIVDRSAYTVEPGQAGMSKALGLDPSKTRAVAHASDGHGADFRVVASPERPAGAGGRSMPPLQNPKPAITVKRPDPDVTVLPPKSEPQAGAVYSADPNAPVVTTKPMKRLPNGAMRTTVTDTGAGKPSTAKKSTPEVTTLPRSSDPYPDPNVVPRSPGRNVYPDFEPVPPGSAVEKYARAHTARLSEQIRKSGITMTIPADRVLNAPYIGRIRHHLTNKIQSSTTSEGWLRNQSRFWTQWKKQFPDDAKLLGPNQTVSKELADKYGWPTSGPNNVVGQKLVHHHIDNGSLTVAIPENVHQKLSGEIHATPTVVGRP
jgi:HNH/Endo VII superfamily nuclease toxin with a HHH motif